MMTYGAPRYDSGRWGQEVFRASPRQADLMIVAGRVSQKMAPVLRQIYDQMPNPKWVLAMGVCASTGGMFNNYAIVQGVDHVVPVDMYLPGCPPRPEMLIDAMFKLRDKVRHLPIGQNLIDAQRGGGAAPAGSADPGRAEGSAPVTEDTPRRPPRKRTRKTPTRKPAEISREPDGRLPEPVEEQDEGASTSDLLSSAKGSADIHKESDENAPIKGAVPEGESEPDAGTKPESVTAEAPDVATTDTEADEDERPAGDSPSPRPKCCQVRKGMFGVHGSGDTIRLRRTDPDDRIPGSCYPPYGGWWDQVNDRIGALIPNFSDVIEKVVVYRGEITFHVARGSCRCWSAPARRRPSALRVLQQRLGRALPAGQGPRAARGLPPAVDDLQPAAPARSFRTRLRPAYPVGRSHLPDSRLARARDVRHVRA